MIFTHFRFDLQDLGASTGCDGWDHRLGVPPQDEREEVICDWDDLRELERHGVSIQLHCVSHRTFSYGDSGSDPVIAAHARTRTEYRAAGLYGGGPNVLPIPGPYRLTRLAMGSDTDLHAALDRRAS